MSIRVLSRAPYFMLKFGVDKATGKKDVVRLICVIYTHILTQESRNKIDNLVKENPNPEVQEHYDAYKRIMEKCSNEATTDPINFINIHKPLINDIIGTLKSDPHKPIEIPITIPEEDITKENFEEFKTHVNENVGEIIRLIITPVEPPNPLQSLTKLQEAAAKGDFAGAYKTLALVKPGVKIDAGGGKRNVKKSKKIKKRNKTRNNKNNKNKSKRYWY